MDFSHWDNISLKDGLTLSEIVNIIENDVPHSDDESEKDEVAGVDVFITPAEPSALTDEDSADEDAGGTVDNLSRRQLLAEAEIRIRSKNSKTHSSTVKDYGASKAKWIKGDLQFINRKMFDGINYSKYKNMSAVQLFESFIDDEILRLIETEIKKYSLFLNLPDPCITIRELKCFLGILIVSGYNTLPGKKYYWDTKLDMKNNLVSESMRRDRFIQIMKFLHFSDNSRVDKTDKFFKIRPLAEHIRQKCLNNFVPYEYLSYDESMIKYFGKHSCKQFIRGKPIRFGYKAWCLNTDYGYMVNFELYQGKAINSNLVYESLVGKAAAPLLSMLDQIPDDKKTYPYNIFFDNLFTGFPLLRILKDRGYFGTGTIRENRIPKDCPILSKKNMKNFARGSYESALDKTSGALVLKWKDNAVVAAASTAYGAEPMASVKRFSQKEKKIIRVAQPQMIRECNKHMGGTDRMDEDINAYRIGIRGKKFWWPLFTWLLDVAIQNSWVLYKKAKGPITKLEFRREIAQTYLNTYKTSLKSLGGLQSKPFTYFESGSTANLRYDNYGHFVTKNDNNKRRKCGYAYCTSQTRTRCVKCDVGLCVECFIPYHTKM